MLFNPLPGKAIGVAAIGETLPVRVGAKIIDCKCLTDIVSEDVLVFYDRSKGVYAVVGGVASSVEDRRTTQFARRRVRRRRGVEINFVILFSKAEATFRLFSGNLSRSIGTIERYVYSSKTETFQKISEDRTQQSSTPQSNLLPGNGVFTNLVLKGSNYSTSNFIGAGIFPTSSALDPSESLTFYGTNPSIDRVGRDSVALHGRTGAYPLLLPFVDGSGENAASAYYVKQAFFITDICSEISPLQLFVSNTPTTGLIDGAGDGVFDGLGQAEQDFFNTIQTAPSIAGVIPPNLFISGINLSTSRVAFSLNFLAADTGLPILGSGGFLPSFLDGNFFPSTIPAVPPTPFSQIGTVPDVLAAASDSAAVILNNSYLLVGNQEPVRGIFNTAERDNILFPAIARFPQEFFEIDESSRPIRNFDDSVDFLLSSNGNTFVQSELINAFLDPNTTYVIVDRQNNDNEITYQIDIPANVLRQIRQEFPLAGRSLSFIDNFLSAQQPVFRQAYRATGIAWIEGQ